MFLPGLGILVLNLLFPDMFAREKGHVGIVYKLEKTEMQGVVNQILICFIAGALNFYLLHLLINQSLFGGTLEMKLFFVCNSAWEELFFSMLQIFVMRFAIGWGSAVLGVGFRGFTFGIYHVVVYGEIIAAMIGMLFMGFIYGVALVAFKHVDVCIATHMLMNLIAS